MEPAKSGKRIIREIVSDRLAYLKTEVEQFSAGKEITGGQPILPTWDSPVVFTEGDIEE